MTDVALITGTSSGMGMHAAVHLAQRGLRVVATMRDPRGADRLHAAAEAAGVTLDVRALDVVDHAASAELVAAIVAEDVIAADEREDDLDRLTPREREVLQLVAEGQTNRLIALRLGLSPKTVDSHRTNLMRKLGLHDAQGLTRFAVRRGLVSPE